MTDQKPKCLVGKVEGRKIIGTYETLEGTALVLGFEKNPKTGELEPMYSGETKLWWDNQRPIRNQDGEMLVIDDDHNIWPISKVEWEEVDELDV